MVPRQRRHRNALLLRRDDEQSQHRQHGAVHGHRHAHRVERDALEQGAHVVEGIDGDAGHADVAGDARMIAVIAAMGGEIEGDRKPLLPAGEIGAIEGVGLLGRREARILPHRPRLVDVHGGIGAAHVRRQAGPGVQVRQAGEIVGGVEGFDRDRPRGSARARLRAGAGELTGANATVEKSGMRMSDGVASTAERGNPAIQYTCGHSRVSVDAPPWREAQGSQRYEIAWTLMYRLLVKDEAFPIPKRVPICIHKPAAAAATICGDEIAVACPKRNRNRFYIRSGRNHAADWE